MEVLTPDPLRRRIDAALSGIGTDEGERPKRRSNAERSAPLVPPSRRRVDLADRRARALDGIGRTPEVDTDSEAFGIAQAAHQDYGFASDAREAIQDAPGLTDEYRSDLAHYSDQLDLIQRLRSEWDPENPGPYLDALASAPDFDGEGWSAWADLQADARQRTGYRPPTEDAGGVGARLDARLDPTGQPRWGMSVASDATGTQGFRAPERVAGTTAYDRAEERRQREAEEAARLASAREEHGVVGEAWNAAKNVPKQALNTFVGGTGNAIAAASDLVGLDGVSDYFTEGADRRRAAIARLVPTDEGLDLGLPSQAGGAIGSTAPFVVGGWATGSTRAVPAAMGSGLNAGQQYREADAAREAGEADDSDVAWATLLGGAVGVSEAVPIGRMFSRADRATGGGLRRALAHALAEAGEEGAQEMVQGILNDAVARGTHDEDRPFDLRLHDALIGAIAGGTLGAAVEAPGLVRDRLVSRSASDDGAPPVAPEPTSSEGRIPDDDADTAPDAADTAPTAPAPERREGMPDGRDVGGVELDPRVEPDRALAAEDEPRLEGVPLDAERAAEEQAPGRVPGNAPRDDAARDQLADEQDGTQRDRAADLRRAERAGDALGAPPRAEQDLDLLEADLQRARPSDGRETGGGRVPPDGGRGEGAVSPDGSPQSGSLIFPATDEDVAAGSAPPPAASGPTRTFQRGQRGSVVVTFADPDQADLYDFASLWKLSSRGRNESQATRERKAERRRVLEERLREKYGDEYLPLALAEYDHVREQANAAPDPDGRQASIDLTRASEPGESRAAAQNSEDSALTGETEQLPQDTTGQAPPAERGADEPFDAYLARARASLAAEADREIESAAQETDDPTAARIAVAERSDNPVTVLRGWKAARESESASLDPTASVDAAIAEALPYISSAEVGELGDVSGAQRRAYFRAPRRGTATGAGSGKARPTLAEAAEVVTTETGIEVSTADVVSFVKRFPGGASSFRADVRRPRRQIEDRLREITGEPVSRQRVEAYLARLEAPAPSAGETESIASETLDPTPGRNGEGYGSRNTFVTETTYRDALAVLGRTAPFSNPHLDPKVWTAAGQVAAFHAEALAREGVAQAGRFAEFSRRALRDLGQEFEPHLRRLYDAATESIPQETGTESAERAADAPQDARAASVPTPEAPTDDGAPAASQGAETDGAPGGLADDVVPPPPPATAGEVSAHLARLTQAEIARTRAALDLATLPPAQRRTWEATLAEVVESGLHHEAESIARAVLEKKDRLPSAREHVALLVRLAGAQRTYRETAAAIRRAEEQGQPTGALQRRAEAALTAVDLLTEAGQRAGTDVGAALAIRRLRLAEEAGGYTVARALNDARVLKGASLTDAERSEIATLAEQAEEATAQREEADRTATKRREAREQEEAERVVEREARRAAEQEVSRAKRAARLDAIREEREAIKADLARLGLRLNDALGLTAEGAVLVGRLGLTYAKAAPLRLEQVVERVLQDLPDLDPADVIRAIAGMRADPTKKGEPRDEELERALVEESRARKAVRAAQRALAPTTAKDRWAAVAGLPRSVLATGDMSAVGNQAAPAIRRHPVIAARTFRDAFTTFFSEYDAERLDLTVRTGEMQPVREMAELYLAPLGDAASSARLVDREETFTSRLVERSPWLVRAVVGAGVGTATFGPGLGTVGGAVAGVASKAVMRASEAHMVSFLNLLRVRIFDAFAEAHPDASMEELRAYASTVNLLTGRGSLSDDVARIGAWFAFSPRLTAARFQAPLQIVRPGVPRSARLEALGSLAALVGVNLAVLALADLALGDDGDVGTDPRSSDFGKIRWGSMRVDIWGGYALQARLFLRGMLAATDAYGVTETPPDRREIDPLTEVGRFANSKKSPWIGVGVSLLTGRDFLGEPIAPHETLAQSLTPIGVQAARDASQTAGDGESPAVRAATATALNFFGFGSDAYDDPTARSTVLPLFERAHLARHTSAPQEIEGEDERIAFRDDYRQRLAGKVEREAPVLRRIAEPAALAERLKALKSEARDEAAGVALNDPLRQGLPLQVIRRSGYTPFPGAAEGLTDGQRAARRDTFRVRMADLIRQDRAVLEPETDPGALRSRLEDLAALARAQTDRDPLAPALPVLLWADYDARPYAPSEMPERERDVYGADFARRLSRLVLAEQDALVELGPEEAKERLRSLASRARREAREAAGY